MAMDVRDSVDTYTDVPCRQDKVQNAIMYLSTYYIPISQLTCE